MASAFYDRARAGWIADFRGLYQTGKQRRRVRIDKRHLVDDEAHAAALYAAECERYCRLLERAEWRDPETIAHAARLGAITEPQRVALLANNPHALAVGSPMELTLEDAAIQHPATIREEQGQDWIRHRRELREFVAFSGVRLCRDLTLQSVMAWVQHLRRDGYRTDGIRHRLIWLRRASRIAGMHGLPDPLTRIKLIEDSDPRDPEAYTLQEIGAALRRCEDPRVTLAILLGAGMGLDAGEIRRARGIDVLQDLQQLDIPAGKTKARRRRLPMPAVVLRFVMPLVRGDAPLIRPESKASRGAGFADAAAWSHWLSPRLSALTGRRLPANALRKSFASIMDQPDRLEGRAIEYFMGHRFSHLAGVTSAHYRDRSRLAEMFRPAADRIDAIFAPYLPQLLPDAPILEPSPFITDF
jgi:hypothetical protein